MNVTIRQVKEAIQALLVSKSAIATDVRELYYQGDTFVYPCVRWECICEPDECSNIDVNFTTYCWSEDPSSLEATRMVDELAAGIDGNTYIGAIKLQLLQLLSVPTVARDDRLWRGEAFFKCLATTL